MRAHCALRSWGSGPLVVLLIGGWMLALAACAPQLSPASPPASYFSATDISMDSLTDGWAVGRWITPASSPGHETTSRFALAHLQQGQWRLVPTSVTGDLGADPSYNLVRMLSPTDGWATSRGSVVHYGDDIYHYDGARWRLVYPPAGVELRSITIADLEMLSPDLGWAVGEDGILQYTHGAWMNVTDTLPPPPADWLASWEYPGLRTVTIVSPTDVWATGDGGLIWRYDGAQWRIAASPYFPNRYYTSASVDGFITSDALLAKYAVEAHKQEAIYASQMLSPTQGWSVGGATLVSSRMDWGPAVVEQYQAGSWQVTHIVMRNTSQPFEEPVFYSLAMNSMQDGWIGGAWVHPAPKLPNGDTTSLGDTPVYEPLLLHYHAGVWTFASAPAVGAIHRVAMASPDEGWAASDGGLLHYTGGQWRLVVVRSATS